MKLIVLSLVVATVYGDAYSQCMDAVKLVPKGQAYDLAKAACDKLKGMSNTNINKIISKSGNLYDTCVKTANLLSGAQKSEAMKACDLLKGSKGPSKKDLEKAAKMLKDKQAKAAKELAKTQAAAKKMKMMMANKAENVKIKAYNLKVKAFNYTKAFWMFKKMVMDKKAGKRNMTKDADYKKAMMDMGVPMFNGTATNKKLNMNMTMVRSSMDTMMKANMSTMTEASFKDSMVQGGALVTDAPLLSETSKAAIFSTVFAFALVLFALLN